MYNSTIFDTAACNLMVARTRCNTFVYLDMIAAVVEVVGAGLEVAAPDGSLGVRILPVVGGWVVALLLSDHASLQKQRG